ncbi:hypothetical protein GOL85_13410 [Sinorhizobium medicae]|nr:hypothetical protein [Sinorhizobium medicae]
MSEYLALVPYPVSVAIAVLGGWLWYVACAKIGRHLADRAPLPQIDFAALQAEMDEEFAPIPVRAK